MLDFVFNCGDSKISPSALCFSAVLTRERPITVETSKSQSVMRSGGMEESRQKGGIQVMCC